MTSTRNSPQTNRGLFYQAISHRLIEKTEREYDNVIVRLVKLLRDDGEPPWEWIVDGTRWMRKPHSLSGVEEAVRW